MATFSIVLKIRNFTGFDWRGSYSASRAAVGVARGVTFRPKQSRMEELPL